VTGRTPDPSPKSIGRETCSTRYGSVRVRARLDDDSVLDISEVFRAPGYYSRLTTGGMRHVTSRCVALLGEGSTW
jgi:hypothetical protein